MKQRQQVGRMVFHSDFTWTVLTLECHVNNVVRLVDAWDWRHAFQADVSLDLGISHDYVISAAQVHDMAKPQYFRLKYGGSKHGPAKWEYSFSGHRFGVHHDHLYVKLLGLLHHEFSVDSITKATAQLRSNPDTAFFADNFALDLYTLEMADQIEATVARAAVGSEAPEERVFMDFVFEQAPSVNFMYRIDPCPFINVPVQLQIEYVVLRPPHEQVIAVEQAKSQDERSSLLKVLQNWLLEELQTATMKTQEIALWPWTR
jgi:hypothetical protein